jgi:hypothetical protein
MRAIGSLVLGGIVAAALALGIAAPASAATSPLQYSMDDVTWSSTAPSGLFPSSLRLSPGDSRSITVYVRSTRTDPTTMSAALTRLVSSSAQFSAAVTIGATGGSGPGWHSPASTMPTCAPIFSKFLVGAGQIVPVTITVTLSSALNGRQEQGGHLGFDLLLGLADVGAPLAPGGCPSSGTSIPAFNPTGPTMAFTGTETLNPGLTIAAFAGGLGVLLLVAARRRRRLGA